MFHPLGFAKSISSAKPCIVHFSLLIQSPNLFIYFIIHVACPNSTASTGIEYSIYYLSITAMLTVRLLVHNTQQHYNLINLRAFHIFHVAFLHTAIFNSNLLSISNFILSLCSPWKPPFGIGLTTLRQPTFMAFTLHSTAFDSDYTTAASNFTPHNKQCTLTIQFIHTFHNPCLAVFCAFALLLITQPTI